MIREHRSREKLLTYYDKYINEGVIDPNVHPWVAESWMKSKKLNVQSDTMFTGRKLSTEDFRLLQAQHKEAVDYLEVMVDNIREFFQKYNLCLLLLDADCVVLKSYALPYFQMTAGEIEGVRVGIEEVGTSSISIAREHETPFWLFGPEMWVKDCQGGDACSAPVYMNGELSYMLTLVAVKQSEMPQDAVIAMLLTLGKSLEFYLSQMQRLQAQETILDATPFAVYHVMPGGDVAYANKLGLTRLAGIGAQKNEREMPNLSDVVMNYRHTPIYNGFRGVPSHNKEVTWITQAKTYEDITTVVPLGRDIDQAVSSVVVVSMPIEDLRTLVAHAAGYTAKYSLSSMVGEGTTFAAMKDKAARVAKNKHHVLIQGESGTGKQRLAHGIHQASPRAAGPLITLRCGDATPELLEQADVSWGERVAVSGQIRSFNQRATLRRKLVISVYAETLTLTDEQPDNRVRLTGALCRAPVFRRTPLGREICDGMLAVNRPYHRTDYLPCIFWGRTARQVSQLGVGSKLCLEGRLQSRVYTKLLDDGTAMERTAYEISAVSAQALTAEEEVPV